MFSEVILHVCLCVDLKTVITNLHVVNLKRILS